MVSAIAIVGMACRFPDARTPSELWENALSQRRAFRLMPPERLRLKDYFSLDRHVPDSIYTRYASLIEGYEFDRVRYCVAGNTFRSADLAHWLALDIAGQALADAGFVNGDGLPRESTGVFLGNTLTGEFSRANVMRLRWPYVRRVVDAALVKHGWSFEQRTLFVNELETAYKKPFPNIGEESLAGGLSNTIAGRVCNHFDLKGGGYTIDGACASSLLAISHACSALVTGDVDVALAGGVDLSLDPFELVGFAKTNALASDAMRVYDKRSNGFWPGEGCGMVVLIRHEDALAQHRRIYATIRGWGISSDGKGGITRPEIEGQMLALRRAYQRAGFGIETVSYFEGHGTGTNVGDAVELRALSSARNEVRAPDSQAAIGSIKANIGHTKAAAGVAGLIKATLTVCNGIIPPTTGCEIPHEEFTRAGASIRCLKNAETWPPDQPRRAGVNSMGFGGINVHVVLEADPHQARTTITSTQRTLTSPAQDAELLLLSGDTVADLRSKVDHLLGFADRISQSELSDLAHEAQRSVADGAIRAAVVASSPAGLHASLTRLVEALESRQDRKLDAATGVFLCTLSDNPRIGFLFPGQGSPSHVDGGILRRCFDFVAQLYEGPRFADRDEIATAIAQPAIATASVGALRVLQKLNITAGIAIGHSLGELTAFHWAGAYDEEALLRIAKIRGEALQATDPNGAMASIGADAEKTAALTKNQPIYIAALNSSSQTVVSGEREAIDAIIARAHAQNIKAARLPVSHAFHSPLVASGVPALSEFLSTIDSGPLQHTVVSTITGELLSTHADLRELIRNQVTSPVLFERALTLAEHRGVDLWLEVGPGHILGGLLAESTNTPVISIDAGGESIRGLLNGVAAAFVLGESVNHSVLFERRFTRRFNLDWQPRFFANPCESAPVSETTPSLEVAPSETVKINTPQKNGHSPIDSLVELVAERTELPPSSIKHDSRLLSDLHLNSITVSQIVVQTAARLGLQAPVSLTEFADSTIAEVARALEEQSLNGHLTKGERVSSLVSGVDSWVRAFRVKLVERPPVTPANLAGAGSWEVIGLPDPLTDAVRTRFQHQAGNGVVVCLQPESEARIVEFLLGAVRSLKAKKNNPKFILIQRGCHAASFARTLHLETKGLSTCVVNLPDSDSHILDWAIDEASAVQGFAEVFYDRNGRRYESVVQLHELADVTSKLTITNDDLLLVTGGGKGITAECAFGLALETGARLVLFGRSVPERDTTLAANLRRMQDAGIRFKYLTADVSNASAVREVVQEVEKEFGPITAILHGAGRNEPQLLGTLSEAAFKETLAVKVDGARNLLSAIDSDKLRLFVGFGSVIARTGLPGEADYALANELLTSLIEDWKSTHAACRCLAIEWSIWSELGMGARLGRTDRLLEAGITPISPDQGVAMFLQLLRQPHDLTSVVVMGRYCELPTFKIECPELPFLRFLEHINIYYPGVELVIEANLSCDTDPYLRDHEFAGEKLLPAVMGLEAMAQVASALVGSSDAPSFKSIEFNHPVVISENAPLRIRLAALARRPNLVEVVLRTANTDFQMDHFRALCQFGSGLNGTGKESSQFAQHGNATNCVALDPATDLYGKILFQRGRFRRLSNYRHLTATECFAEFSPNGSTSWFIDHLPESLLLGDPGARDAAMHAIQACIPHLTVLPVAANAIHIEQRPHSPSDRLFVSAQERSSTATTFTYDLDIIGQDGRIYERWQGLKLQAVGKPAIVARSEALLGPYLERRVREAVPGADISIVMQRDPSLDRRLRSDRAMKKALGTRTPITRRPDGKPEVSINQIVSAAHERDFTIAVAGSKSVACDLSEVAQRAPCTWRAMLGDARLELVQLICQLAHENVDISATRVWCATESLKKVGAMINTPLVYVSTTEDGCVLLTSGDFKVVTYATQLEGRQSKVVIAVLADAS